MGTLSPLTTREHSALSALSAAWEHSYYVDMQELEKLELVRVWEHSHNDDMQELDKLKQASS